MERKPVACDHQPTPVNIPTPGNCQSVDWYHEGSSRTVEIGGVQITVHFVNRHGRRARIAIVAPGGAVFWEATDRPAKSA